MWTWLVSNDEVIKNLGQALAWLAAAIFFGWKLGVGYSVINLSVALKLQRLRGNDGDRLKVRIDLTKGDRATLRINEVLISAHSGGQTIATEALSEVKVIRDQGYRKLRLTPGETTHFERCLRVPEGAVVTVDLTVRGEAVFRGEWRASAVSLPEESLLRGAA